MKNIEKDEEKRIQATKSIGELISLSTFCEKINSKDITKVAKYSTIFSFWAEIVGKKFESISRPYSIKGAKLFVMAKSPVVIQELTLFKTALLKKINSYSLPLGIEIKDIVFDYKNFDKKDDTSSSDFIEDKPETITEQELLSIKTDSELVEKTKDSIEKLKFLPADKKEELLNKILLSYKAQKFRNLD